jgi:hypothetical protein
MKLSTNDQIICSQYSQNLVGPVTGIRMRNVALAAYHVVLRYSHLEPCDITVAIIYLNFRIKFIEQRSHL